MAFQLQISAKRDPAESRERRHQAAPTSSAVIEMNGTFGDAAREAVLATIARLFGEGAESILVELQDVESHDAVCVRRFAGEVMEHRGCGRHVQVAVRQAAFHASLAELPSARDWLLAFTEGDVRGGRRGIHLDRPRAN